jgi:rhodanese-related sulfurtransferase
MVDWDMYDDYLVYCHADGPSIQGARMLVDAGFPTVYRLVGNYGAWVGAGYATEMN